MGWCEPIGKIKPLRGEDDTARPTPTERGRRQRGVPLSGRSRSLRWAVPRPLSSGRSRSLRRAVPLDSSGLTLAARNRLPSACCARCGVELSWVEGPAGAALESAPGPRRNPPLPPPWSTSSRGPPGTAAADAAETGINEPLRVPRATPRPPRLPAQGPTRRPPPQARHGMCGRLGRRVARPGWRLRAAARPTPADRAVSLSPSCQGRRPGRGSPGGEEGHGTCGSTDVCAVGPPALQALHGCVGRSQTACRGPAQRGRRPPPGESPNRLA